MSEILAIHLFNKSFYDALYEGGEPCVSPVGFEDKKGRSDDRPYQVYMQRLFSISALSSSW
jgi:hypothetical protein